jgi:ArsR family transcriptional regulator, arsenate/arsenite/antimonite-responsive transcriptional repressor
MRPMMDVLKALSDENRVRALMALHDSELCVCQIIELLQLAPSTVSKHMSILKQARLVESRKEGRWILYRLAEEDAPEEARSAIEWLVRTLEADDRIRTDERDLAAILRKDPEELCRTQATR